MTCRLRATNLIVLNIEEARERLNLLIEETQDIEVQLSDPEKKDPKTGEVMDVDAYMAWKFKANRALSIKRAEQRFLKRWIREAIVRECDLMRRPDKPLQLTPTNRRFQHGLSLSAQANTFSVCFGCETCTTVCPVVSNYENPREVLGLLPHQIMHACGLGVRDLAFGSNMLWDCITCYQCQEQCPQGVDVTDVLYELKNLAVEGVKEKTLQGQ